MNKIVTICGSMKFKDKMMEKNNNQEVFHKTNTNWIIRIFENPL